MENYFVLARENNDSYPLLVFDDYETERHFKRYKPIELSSPVKLSIGKPKPRQPVLVDYHKTPLPVFSEKIRDVLAPMNIFGSQLVPAEIKLRGKRHPYWILHTINKIDCIDKENSEMKMITPQYIGEITKLVLKRTIDCEATQFASQREAEMSRLMGGLFG